MLHRRSFEALRAGYRSGAWSPVEVAESALRHAQKVQGELNAFAWLDPRRALSAAEASARRWKSGAPIGALDGMPFTVKEFAAVQGWPTRRGSRVTSAEPVPHSAVFVDRLLDAGVVLLGKTRAPEFNWKGVTDSPGYGLTRNPWDARLTPGGSSGGCAAAVAAGVVRVSLGSDAGGSVRIPAAFTGTVALKPSFGRIPQVPLPSAFFNVTHTGPIAASVGELAEVMRIVGGPHAGDWSSIGLRELSFGEISSARKLRIGLLASDRWESACDPVVRKGMQETLALLSEGGFEIRTVDFDVRRASQVGAFFYTLGCRAAVRAVPDELQDQLDPELVRFVRSVEEVGLEELIAMQQQRDLLAAEIHAAFDTVDVVMLPTLPILPFEAGRNVPEGSPSSDWMSWNPFTPAFNLSQMPALSYPVWPRGAALPMGVQFVAAKGFDDHVLAIAAWLEQRFPISHTGSTSA